MVHQAVRIDLVDYPIGIVLRGRCEYNQFITNLTHLLQELDHTWANAIIAHSVQLKVMHKSLVQVQHQGILVWIHSRRKLWHFLQVAHHRRKRLKPDDGPFAGEAVRSEALIWILSWPRRVSVCTVDIQQRHESHILEHVLAHGPWSHA